MHKFNLILSLLVSVVSLSTWGQTTYQFIEPAVSVSYSDSAFKVGTRYSNTAYETEAYEFQYRLDSANNISIYLAANHPGSYPPKRIRDSFMLLGINNLKTIKNDSFSVARIDEVPKDVLGFSCFGVVAYDKINER
jgi:hypothetical protein